jgi:hypothetical protein
VRGPAPGRGIRVQVRPPSSERRIAAGPKATTAGPPGPGCAGAPSRRAGRGRRRTCRPRRWNAGCPAGRRAAPSAATARRPRPAARSCRCRAAPRGPGVGRPEEPARRIQREAGGRRGKGDVHDVLRRGDVAAPPGAPTVGGRRQRAVVARGVRRAGSQPATMRLKLPPSLPPTGLKFTPASSDTAVDPRSPAATMRPGDANAAACTGSGEGVTREAISPASAVRTSWSPRSVVKTHSWPRRSGRSSASRSSPTARAATRSPHCRWCAGAGTHHRRRSPWSRRRRRSRARPGRSR